MPFNTKETSRICTPAAAGTSPRRYLFRLFALDRMLQSEAAMNRRKPLRLVETGGLAEATLIGYYAPGGAEKWEEIDE